MKFWRVEVAVGIGGPTLPPRNWDTGAHLDASSSTLRRANPTERTELTDVVITSAARTAIGSYGKGLAAVPPSELGAIAASAALERSGIEPSQIEHVVFGNVIHTEPGDMYM